MDISGRNCLYTIVYASVRTLNCKFLRADGLVIVLRSNNSVAPNGDENAMS